MPHRDLRFTHDYVEDAPPIVPIQGAVSGKTGGPVTDHSHTGSGDGGTFDAANLRSDEDAENGAVLSSDGAEGSEWRLLTLGSLSDVNAPDPDDGDVPTWDDVAGKWVAAASAGGTVDAADVTYAPTTAADWDGSADPGDVDGALDQLAERVKDIEDAGGAGSPDASAVTYTPTTATDWDGNADPGNVDNALDQLAERVDDLEGVGGGGATPKAFDWESCTATTLTATTSDYKGTRIVVFQFCRISAFSSYGEWANGETYEFQVYAMTPAGGVVTPAVISGYTFVGDGSTAEKEVTVDPVEDLEPGLYAVVVYNATNAKLSYASTGLNTWCLVCDSGVGGIRWDNPASPSLLATTVYRVGMEGNGYYASPA